VKSEALKMLKLNLMESLDLMQKREVLYMIMVLWIMKVIALIGGLPQSMAKVQVL
jgi:hypothetical protein